MGRYRKKGEPTNTTCDGCNEAIWVPDGIHTIYHGKANHSNKTGTPPESFCHLTIGNLCPDCWEVLKDKKDYSTKVWDTP